jgi:hypothetical protein
MGEQVIRGDQHASVPVVEHGVGGRMTGAVMYA